MASAQAAIDQFYKETRLRRINLDTMTKPTGGGQTSQTIRRVGLLQGIWLPISITVAGSLSNLNTLGIVSAIRRIRVTVNSSGDIFSCSGAGALYLVNEQIGDFYSLGQGTTNNQGGSAVSAATFKLYFYIPIAMNRRDPVGLVLLQSEQQTVELTIDWEADTTVATGATITGSVRPQIDAFSVPASGVLPPLNYIHQVIEDSYTVSGSGDITYSPIRGQVYLSVYHGLSLLQSSADSASRLQVIVNGSDTWKDMQIADMDAEYYLYHGRNRKAGVYPVDYMASSELGALGLTRDFFNTLGTTDYRHILTATGAGTLTTVRRMLALIPAVN